MMAEPQQICSHPMMSVVRREGYDADFIVLDKAPGGSSYLDGVKRYQA